MAREHVTLDEVHRALREHGVESVKDVSLAVLEVDGSISVLKYDDVRATVAVPAAESHVHSGPYTDASWRQMGSTRRANGSSG